mgnify:FL=1
MQKYAKVYLDIRNIYAAALFYSSFAVCISLRKTLAYLIDNALITS